MPKSLRLLSKSRFKLACECPTKLFYTGKSEYGNNNSDNAFLNALAEGGFQVGALAKINYPDGVEVSTLNTDQAVKETTELLKKESVTIFEPAIAYKNLLVRVDILIKNGSSVELVEVKAKSFDSSEEDQFYNKKDLKRGVHTLNSEWEPYLQDIAFQTYVAKSAFPKWKVTSSLLLADKNKVASVDGINQRFLLKKDDQNRTSVVVKDGTNKKSVGSKLLTKVSVDQEVAVVFDSKFGELSFSEFVEKMAKAYEKDKMIQPVLGSYCKSCEFRIDENLKKSGLKSGFEECWKVAANLKPSDFKRPFVFDVWNFRKATNLISEGVYFLDQIEESDIAPKPREEESGLSGSERQWLQVNKVKSGDSSPYLDIAALQSEFASWSYPLHFIDFETTMVAIPFNKGRHPYEQIAFQFSHHIVESDGRTDHRTQYINQKQGHFPNFDFVRALKGAIGNDNGTVFRYAAHENTVLCQIRSQLKASDEIDKEELIKFIESITTSTGDSAEEWQGKRSMVDLCDLVKRYFYHPATAGSNSIKKVLPAILQTSKHLQEKYSKPIYGNKTGLKSLNFEKQIWIKSDSSGSVCDPYKLLPPVFDDLSLDEMDSLITGESLADGGAAMTAYARMQFTEMSETERERVTKALLRYCELDTFAMVLIYEYWKSEIESKNIQEAV